MLLVVVGYLVHLSDVTLLTKVEHGFKKRKDFTKDSTSVTVDRIY